MAAKIITLILIFIINLTIGAGFVFMLMLGLNGFSEHDANYAFLLFIIGGLLASLAMAAAGFFLVRALQNKNWKGYTASAAAVVAFSALGFLIKVVLFFVAIFTADFVRTSR